ncbi:transmembrane protein 106A [Phyllostomus discolor]|uniref:Transmembrane protein 106A n=1 Tax=Phyllostomus discolor TaxID=89673 RepID=A0A833ZPE8_9CHIR|nr:transmembrane protein 106A [Phyllostomus discolor]
MGEAFSQLGSREDENKPILRPAAAIVSKAARCASHGSSKLFSSCASCERAARASFVTCPTCQGSGEIPRGAP